MLPIRKDQFGGLSGPERLPDGREYPVRIVVAVGSDQGDAALTVLDALSQPLSRTGEHNRKKT